ncbi:PhoH-like protein [Candidatus Pandoraea novymonadis]|uniref:PhoH-like protein n=1 Tax=Candidatus Pandoraea novymonadis TaxID=1808959 RepID=A0ABX5FDC5_9BURK|nr:PhoH-like protein [Candidatus Pandoraea novymonadis]
MRGKNASVTVQVLENFYNLAIKPLSIEDIHLGLVKIRHEYMPSVCIADGKKFLESNDANARQESSLLLSTRRPDLRGRTATQCEYLNKILSHDVTFGIGPAGTGKTYLAVACAIDALERDVIKRIILTRPAVEAGEHLGFLPGDLAQKVDPYLRPLYDALYELCGLDKTQKYFEKQMIEIAPLAYMRGRTLNHAFVILDEAQNTTPEQMKMFLTRIGFGSKAVVTGDTTQVDLPRGQKSGLHESQFILKDVYGIAFTRFTSVDVVRHPLVGRIVEAYDAHALAATYDDTEHQIKHCLRG